MDCIQVPECISLHSQLELIIARLTLATQIYGLEAINMAPSSTGCLNRKPFMSSALLVMALLLGFGFFCDYKYESVVRRLRIGQTPCLNPSLESSGVNSSSVKFHNSNNHQPWIFLYNKYFGSADWDSQWDSVDGSSVVRTLKNCPAKCLFTSDPYFLKSADFVLVSLASYKNRGGKPVNLTYPKGDQIWTGFLLEGPHYGEGYEAVDGIFDWVATYRCDSDIFVPYGQFYQTNVDQSVTDLDSMRVTPNHKKLAVWLVSHCNTKSQRDTLVKTLQRYIPVDVFGKCSKNKCPETKDLSCRDYMGQNYKFYLAFENSLCVDYVTEKFFLAYQNNMVPVTFGWVDYSLYGPPGSYINALDFDSVEDLANYLLYLDKNEDEYLKYFEWRGKYNVQFLKVEELVCTACKRMGEYMEKRRTNMTYRELHEKDRPMKWYPSFRKWQASLPTGQFSALLHVGRNIIINSTKGCIEPTRHSSFMSWIQGNDK